MTKKLYVPFEKIGNAIRLSNGRYVKGDLLEKILHGNETDFPDPEFSRYYYFESHVNSSWYEGPMLKARLSERISLTGMPGKKGPAQLNCQLLVSDQSEFCVPTQPELGRQVPLAFKFSAEAPLLRIDFTLGPERDLAEITAIRVNSRNLPVTPGNLEKALNLASLTADQFLGKIRPDYKENYRRIFAPGDRKRQILRLVRPGRRPGPQ